MWFGKGYKLGYEYGITYVHGESGVHSHDCFLFFFAFFVFVCC